jgi:hypothetical protein
MSAEKIWRVELFKESIINKEGFLRENLSLMVEESPYLAEVAVVISRTSPDPLLSLEWAVLYYSLKRNLIKEKGNDWSFSDEKMRAYHWEQIEWSMASQGRGEEGAMLKQMEDGKNRIIEEDKSQNEELGMFWSDYRMTGLHMLMRDIDPITVEQIFEALDEVAALINVGLEDKTDNLG